MSANKKNFSTKQIAFTKPSGQNSMDSGIATNFGISPGAEILTKSENANHADPSKPSDTDAASNGVRDAIGGFPKREKSF